VSEQLQVGWDTFLEWSSLFYSAPEFNSEERDGKLAAVEPLKLCRQHLLADDTWLPELRNGLTNSHSGGVDFRLADRYLTWAERNQDRAGESLAALWAVEAEDGPARVNAFDLLLPVEAASGTGTRLNLASYLLGAIDLNSRAPNPRRPTARSLSATRMPWPSSMRSPSTWQHGERSSGTVWMHRVSSGASSSGPAVPPPLPSSSGAH
jgi:hypothetical protein